jgi:hypothetical protein
MISKCRDIIACPIFFKQKCFNKTFRNDKHHFYTGISLKQQTIILALHTHKGQHVIFSDVDIIVKDPNLIDYLENYKSNDMTFLMETSYTHYNPGFSFIKSTDETIQCFINIVNRIDTADTDDMSALNYELNTVKSFNGKVGVFSVPEVININTKCEDYSNNKIIQYISENSNLEMKVMSDKLISLALFSDVINNNPDLLIECGKLSTAKCKYCDSNNGCIYWLWKDDNNNLELISGINIKLFNNGKSSRNIKTNKVCEYFDRTQILFAHKYQSESEIKLFNNVRFRSQPTTNGQLITNIGLVNNLILSTSNKYFSWYLNQKMPDDLVDSTKDTYFNLLYNNKNDIIIDEPVFLFMDYETTTSSSHAYDVQFFLLYKYCLSDIKCKLLVVKSENKYYNRLLKLIKDNYNIEYLYIDPNINYSFSTFYSIESYYNIFFDNVKVFINETLIKKIIDKYSSENIPYYDNLYKIKYINLDTVNTFNTGLKLTDEFSNYCISNNIVNLDLIDDYEYRIYLLNMSKKVIISWGSNFIINIVYYIADLSNKKILIACNKNDHPEDFIKCINTNTYKLCMPTKNTKGYIGGLYNNFIINGQMETGLESDSDILNVLF